MTTRPFRKIRTLSRRRIRIVPYNPRARDADGDGLVQEGTNWERPGGSKWVDRAGRELAQAIRNIPDGAVLINVSGKKIQHTPSGQFGGDDGEGVPGKKPSPPLGLPALSALGVPNIGSLTTSIDGTTPDRQQDFAEPPRVPDAVVPNERPHTVDLPGGFYEDNQTIGEGIDLGSDVAKVRLNDDEVDRLQAIAGRLRNDRNPTIREEARTAFEVLEDIRRTRREDRPTPPEPVDVPEVPVPEGLDEPRTIEVSLPRIFYDDHVGRDLPGGEIVNETATRVTVRMNRAEIEEVRSDANFYVAERRAFGPEQSGVVRSAQATLNALDKINDPEGTLGVSNLQEDRTGIDPGGLIPQRQDLTPEQRSFPPSNFLSAATGDPWEPDPELRQGRDGHIIWGTFDYELAKTDLDAAQEANTRLRWTRRLEGDNRLWDHPSRINDESEMGAVMRAWRSDFANSLNLKAILDGRDPAEAYDNPRARSQAEELEEALGRAEKLGVEQFRFQKVNEVPVVGQNLEWSAASATPQRDEAENYLLFGEFNPNNANVVFVFPDDTRGIYHDDIGSFPRESIVSGRFEVVSVEDTKIKNQKAHLVTLKYVGASPKIDVKEDDPELNVSPPLQTKARQLIPEGMTDFDTEVLMADIVGEEDNLYHVTTAASAVQVEGFRPGAGPGFGTDRAEGTPNVSVTYNQYVAENYAVQMRIAVTAARTDENAGVAELVVESMIASTNDEVTPREVAVVMGVDVDSWSPDDPWSIDDFLNAYRRDRGGIDNWALHQEMAEAISEIHSDRIAAGGDDPSDGPDAPPPVRGLGWTIMPIQSSREDLQGINIQDIGVVRVGATGPAQRADSLTYELQFDPKDVRPMAQGDPTNKVVVPRFASQDEIVDRWMADMDFRPSTLESVNLTDRAAFESRIVAINRAGVTQEYADRLETVVVSEVFDEEVISRFVDKYGGPVIMPGTRQPGGLPVPNGLKGQYLANWGDLIVMYDHTPSSPNELNIDDPALLRELTNRRARIINKQLADMAEDTLDITDSQFNDFLPNIAVGGAKGTLRHEMGHYFMSNLDPNDRSEWIDLYQGHLSVLGIEELGVGGGLDAQEEIALNASLVRKVPSNYFFTNSKEGFGEVFSVVTHPDYDRSKYDPSFHPLLDYVERLA